MNEELGNRGLSEENKLKDFSSLYLAHHPLCNSYKNHIFKIGSLYLCVGCTSLIAGFIVYTTLYFTFPRIFQGYPLTNGLISAFGVGLALLQLMIHPSRKIIKIIFRFSLGLAVAAYIGIVFLVENWGIKVGLFVLLFACVITYNSLRKEIDIEECEKCELKNTRNCIDLNEIQ